MVLDGSWSQCSSLKKTSRPSKPLSSSFCFCSSSLLTGLFSPAFIRTGFLRRLDIDRHVLVVICVWEVRVDEFLTEVGSVQVTEEERGHCPGTEERDGLWRLSGRQQRLRLFEQKIPADSRWRRSPTNAQLLRKTAYPEILQTPTPQLVLHCFWEMMQSNNESGFWRRLCFT